ncbi:hypothetical protein OJAV_G00041450 [Oryzias javanicus]|uniref:PB1 domain-containing protein n=1 Tax=Oryzias javanicus TaxID=123683 RepID=A0A437DCY5_ORYJA|nr:hypothetical protein OJAV_G00041450 [Oryzias javanicus]
MSTPAKLRIVLGEDNCVKLTFPAGMPDSADILKSEIQRQCSIDGDFRLQYMDEDFEQFMNLTSMSNIRDKSTIKMIQQRKQPTQSASESPSAPFCDASDSSADTDIHSSSSSEPTTSTSSLRNQGWPLSFPIPAFSYEVEMQLLTANHKFLAEGKHLNPCPKLKSNILDALASEIIRYTAYPSSAQLDDVAQALISKHPSLKEHGSVSGYYGWKISLKYKMGNYRTRLRSLGCPELTINSMKSKQHDKSGSHNQVKKPKRAEVNYFPDYSAGEDKESLEKERVDLLSEVKKRHNHQMIKQKMEKTFALRRHEVIQDKPLVAEIKSRWPALFCEHEVSAEFTHALRRSRLSRSSCLSWIAILKRCEEYSTRKEALLDAK